MKTLKKKKKRNNGLSERASKHNPIALHWVFKTSIKFKQEIPPLTVEERRFTGGLCFAQVHPTNEYDALLDTSRSASPVTPGGVATIRFTWGTHEGFKLRFKRELGLEN